MGGCLRLPPERRPDPDSLPRNAAFDIAGAGRANEASLPRYSRLVEAPPLAVWDLSRCESIKVEGSPASMALTVTIGQRADRL
ncbi:MAG: hypothetical protein CME06_03235 [Gemmatimonadetes bacterium]|nr:hypothetical protein [Gemmatimonadota bacterium]